MVNSTHSDTEYVYADGKLQRTQVLVTKDIPDSEILNEYRGLILRKQQLVRDLRETEDRLRKLRSVAAQVMAHYAASDPAGASAPSEDPDPEEVNKARIAAVMKESEPDSNSTSIAPATTVSSSPTKHVP